MSPTLRRYCADVSEANVRLIRRIYQAFNDDRREMIDAFDPEVEWHAAKEDPDADVYRGREGVVRYLEQWSEALEDIQLQPLEFSDAGDRVFVWQRTTGRGRESGADVVWEGAYVWTLRGGKIVKVQVFFDRDEALEASGFLP
jgi:ketosteroid isomerase-like protein